MCTQRAHTVRRDHYPHISDVTISKWRNFMSHFMNLERIEQNHKTSSLYFRTWNKINEALWLKGTPKYMQACVKKSSGTQRISHNSSRNIVRQFHPAPDYMQNQSYGCMHIVTLSPWKETSKTVLCLSKPLSEISTISSAYSNICIAIPARRAPEPPNLSM